MALKNSLKIKFMIDSIEFSNAMNILSNTTVQKVIFMFEYFNMSFSKKIQSITSQLCKISVF